MPHFTDKKSENHESIDQKLEKYEYLVKTLPSVFNTVGDIVDYMELKDHLHEMYRCALNSSASGDWDSEKREQMYVIKERTVELFDQLEGVVEVVTCTTYPLGFFEKAG
ncbi:MAG: hypothetical protein AAF363_15670 [Bacteroidota bacterium]